MKSVTVIAIFSALCIAVACTKSRNILPQRIIETRLSERQYSVIVLAESGMQDAKQRAKKRAAEITVEHQARYFKIVSEQEVNVMTPTGNPEPLHNNLYQELIIEKDSDRRRFDKPSTDDNGPGYRIIFDILPSGDTRGAIDACSLGACH
ncbi:MAG: hypothetical protein RL235_460 [Chlamydiota bacterium]|jgi:hypothetical protein